MFREIIMPGDKRITLYNIIRIAYLVFVQFTPRDNSANSALSGLSAGQN